MDNNSPYKVWVKGVGDFVALHLRGRPAGFTAKCKIAPPLTSARLQTLQEKLPLPIPRPVTDFLSSASAACKFRYKWDLSRVPEDRVQPTGVTEERIYGGAALCVASSFSKWTTDCKAWATETWIAEDPEQQGIWFNSFPIATIDNGDYLAVRTGDGIDSAVVYLSHDDSSRVIAPSFSAFLSTWARLCYLGPEIWLLENFIDLKTGFLNAETEEAQALRDLFRWLNNLKG